MKNRLRCGCVSPPGSAAFTLVELLVAMVVGSLLVAILFQVFNVASTAWQRGETRLDAFREARGALALMSRDFSYAIAQFPEDPLKVVIPAGSKKAPDALGNPVFVLDAYPQPDLPRDTADKFNEEAYFLTAIPNEAVTSLCAVGYFCAWMPDVAASSGAVTRAPHAYALYRQFLPGGSNGATSSGGTGSSTAKQGLYDRLQAAVADNPLTFLDIFQRVKPPATDSGSPPRAIATELASYIWDLQFRIDTNLTAARSMAQPPPDHSTLYDASAPTRNYAAVSTLYPALLPRFVEIRFKALSASAARQIEGNSVITKQDWAAESTDPGSFYSRFIRPSLQQFVMRVPLTNSRPLP